MEGENGGDVDDFDASSIFFMLRSSPPGSFPITLKPGFSVGIIAYGFISLFIVNGVFYMLQDRVLDDVAPLSEMAIGKYNSLATAFVFGAIGFLFSLVSTVLISYIELITGLSKKIVYIFRFFNIFLSICIVTIGTVLYSDSYLISLGLKGLFFIASILYCAIIIIVLLKEIPIYLSILRAVLILCSLVGFFIMVKSKPFGNYSLGSTRAIGEYILTFSLLIILMTFGKELTDIFIDVVVVPDNQK